MRTALLLLLVADAASAQPKAPLHLAYDAEHLDLDKHVLEFKPSRAIASATLSVIGEDGSELGTGSATYAKGTGWLPITWTGEGHVLKLELRAETSDGVATRLELIPWSVSVDHEDVSFPTDSATIEPGERDKLDASLAKIEEVVKRVDRVMKVRLYVAGHTDTVGPDGKNQKLSLDRARAIATYFRGKGLAIPIAVAGFGERVLKVQTPDNTDERANRRADYVLGPASGAPPFKGKYLQVRADWKQIK